MFDAIKEKAVGLVNTAGRLISSTPALHPLNDPDVWRVSPAYEPPADVNIAKSQKWIDGLMGTTRDGQSIYKLVWNGDRNYWDEYFTQWDAGGKPTAEADKWPRIRYGTIRNSLNGRPVRQLFPPRWLILSRLEPEQYADHYRQESYMFDPSIRAFKQIRPDTAPPVFWLWYMTVAEHDGYCCHLKDKANKKCFGKYAPPEAVRKILEAQRDADIAAGHKAVYEKIDREFINELGEDSNGYRQELEQLLAEAETFIENPMALLGLEQTARAGIDDPKRARHLVKNIYDKRIQEHSKLISK